MGLIIALRRTGDISYFRRYLHRVVSISDVDKILLCSGYISEGKRYSVLKDKLWEYICSGGTGKRLNIVTVAGRFRSHTDSYAIKYGDFVQGIRDRINKAGLQDWSITPWYAEKRNWHAKIAMSISNGEPLAAIIGSSNLTGPAYGETGSRGMPSLFNHECDVVIWKKDTSLDSLFIDGEREDRRERITHIDAFSPILTRLDESLEQADESKRLKAIYRYIIDEPSLRNYDDWRRESEQRESGELKE